MVQIVTTGTVHNGQLTDEVSGWELVAAAQRGDRDAFAQLYRRYAGGLSRFVYARTGDRGLAQDVTSETFTRALRRIDTVTYRCGDPGGWFTTIARNLVTDHYKSSRSRLEHPAAQLPVMRDERSPERAVIATETAARVRAAVAALPTPEQRDCIRLRFWEDRSIAETAAVMGRAPSAVKSLTHRALLGLRGRLITEDPAPVREPGTSPRGRPDPLATARHAVAEVADHMASTDPDTIEGHRADQLARWRTEHRAAVHENDTPVRTAAGGAAWAALSNPIT